MEGTQKCTGGQANLTAFFRFSNDMGWDNIPCMGDFLMLLMLARRGPSTPAIRTRTREPLTTEPPKRRSKTN